jgi:hypothetical protein
MEPKTQRAKLNGILEAIAAGHTCEEILAADHTLSYRDIFHAVAEAPTSYWERAVATNSEAGAVRRVSSPRTPVKQRAD